MSTAWPIPTSVYPIPPGRVPERPWWIPELIHRTSGNGWTRLDGAEVFRADRAWNDPPEDWRARLAAYDRAHPRPRPPYRAGQVWGWEDGATLLVTEASPGGPCPLSSGHVGRACLLFDPLDPTAAPWSPFQEEP